MFDATSVPKRDWVEHALSGPGGPPADTVFVGDSVTDVEASIAAGVPCIGYANKPGKAERLAAIGDAIVIDSMRALILQEGMPSAKRSMHADQDPG